MLLSVLAGPTYIRWARQQIEIGAQAAGRPTPPITAFALTAVADQPETAHTAVRDAVSFFLGAESSTALVGRSQHADAVWERTNASDGAADLTIDDAWIDEFAVAGTPDQVTAGLVDLLDAGATSVGLWLFPPDQLTSQLHRIAEDVLPAVANAHHPI